MVLSQRPVASFFRTAEIVCKNLEIATAEVHKTINPSQSVVKRVRHPRATYGPIGAVVDFSDAWTATPSPEKMEGGLQMRS